MSAISTAHLFKRSGPDHGGGRAARDEGDPLPARTATSQSIIQALLDRTEAAMFRALGSPAKLDTNGSPSAASVAGYHLRCGGRRVRARITLSACLALSVPAEDAIALAAAVELLHNASLIHDDLQDRDATRRGSPAIWIAFGEGLALCSGDLLLSSAYSVVAGFSRPELLGALMDALHQATAEAIEGQCADAYVNSATNIERYREITVAKSGAMLVLPLHLALIAGDQRSFLQQTREACNAFAVGYQIADDLADLASDSKGATGKQALNAVLILQAEGYGEAALSRARLLATESLRIAISKTSGLPADCAWLLRDLAVQVADEL